MTQFQYHDEWGEEQAAQYQPQRATYTDAEVLGRMCRMMEDDPLALYVYCMRVIHQDWTLDRIAKHLAKFRAKEVTRQAIYDRIRKMIAKERDVMPSKMLMPRAVRKITVKPKASTYHAMCSKYRKENHEGS